MDERAIHLHFTPALPFSGFFQLRNARGEISVPATNSIVNRNTTDNTFNFGVDPTFRIGTNVLTLNSGSPDHHPPRLRVPGYR